MKITHLNKQEKLDRMRELYSSAKLAYSDDLEEYEKNLAQYRGSTEIDGSDERAITVRNITYEIIESQISSDIPLPKVDAVFYSEKRDRCAKSVERLLHSLRGKLDYMSINDLDERYTYIYGGSVFYVEWDNTVRQGKEIGAVKLHCLPPRDFIPQPNVSCVDDMDYFFLSFTTTRAELSARFGAKDDELLLAECEFSELEDHASDGDTVSLAVCFYRDEDGEVGKYVFSGNLMLEDVPKYYYRKKSSCSLCGEDGDECKCGGEKITENLIYESLGIETAFLDIPKGAKIPYYVPRSFPIVIRKNTSSDGKLFGQSDCQYIRPEQQAINKIESRILKKLLRAGVTPIVPEDASISLNNSVFGQLIKIKPGESISQYGKVDTTPDISQDIAEAERLYDHSKRILGISDALQGLDTLKNESGYARQLRINQATGRLESKRKMKHGAYSLVDKLIFEHYLAFADEPRALTYKDAYGRIHNMDFCRYDFLEYDDEESIVYFDDSFLFTVDLNEGAEWRREELWERNLENLKAGTLGDPTDPATLLRYWQSQERAHYPFARENVEYFLEAQKKTEGGMMNAEEALLN